MRYRFARILASNRSLLSAYLVMFLVAGCSTRELMHPESALCLDPVTKNKPSSYRPTAWSIGIAKGTGPFTLESDEPHNPVMTPRDVTDRTARFVADPFMMKRAGRWHLFFEVLNCGTEQGDIGYASSNDLKSWKYEGIVLDEEFHLSYPYVFESEGAVYMIPETRQTKAIRLYKASPFPTRWKLEKILVRGNFADSSIIHYQDRWWIFTVEDGYSLAVFYADSLLGPWKKHPSANFYENDKSKTRPGGRLLELNGKIIRFAQDNTLHYGHMVRAFEIDDLTPTSFVEHEVSAEPVLVPGGDSWREVGMHTLDAHQLADHSWVAAVDGSGY